MATPFPLNIDVDGGRKIYFASDIHFGEPDQRMTRQREAKLLRWLDVVHADAAAIIFAGDIWDFWFEYLEVVPRGCVRFMGRLAELTDRGLPIYAIPGNHDLWMGDYLSEELGVQVVRGAIGLHSNGKGIHVAHGDGLGPGDIAYKTVRRIFANRFCQWLFRWLHPDLGIKIARAWSRSSRAGHDIDKLPGPEEERMVIFANKMLLEQHYDYFVFGHRHVPMTHPLNNGALYINLGDWIEHYTYGVFDGAELRLERFDG